MLIETENILSADTSINRVTERPKVTDNVSDMVRSFDLCDEKKINLPQYLIFELDQLPCVIRRVPDGTSKSDLCDLANNCLNS
ncbi:hypothetical protein QYM36_010875 [Artemia franciscana]|uniref:Uncharacterized protein n=1 Tax=Artemia franciscana TaxID=6661 RepID=A0AA88HKH0_ARTSF|nr:hypothetical protein QYM36_010875 [Artemia franciscana]